MPAIGSNGTQSGEIRKAEAFSGWSKLGWNFLFDAYIIMVTLSSAHFAHS